MTSDPSSGPVSGSTAACGRSGAAVCCFFVVLAGLAFPPGPDRAAAQADARDLAVIVHPSTAEDDLSLAELRGMFRGERTQWPDGARVVLFVQDAGTPGGESVVREVCAMSGAEYRRYWATRTFRHEPGVGPKVVASAEMARRLTARVPGAVAVIPASAVDGTVKVLRIDRQLPGTASYPLRMATQ